MGLGLTVGVILGLIYSKAFAVDQWWKVLTTSIGFLIGYIIAEILKG